MDKFWNRRIFFQKFQANKAITPDQMMIVSGEPRAQPFFGAKYVTVSAGRLLASYGFSGFRGFSDSGCSDILNSL